MKKTGSNNNDIIEKFYSEQWDKAMSYLRHSFTLDEEDCKDVIQESFIILHKNIANGKTDNLTSSLSTYFIGICRNKALEMLRGNSRNMRLIDDSEDFTLNAVHRDKAMELMAMCDFEPGIEEEKEKITQRIVKALPWPCNEILWGFYRDNFSMKTLASIYGYSSEGSVKVTKHRCCEKFRQRYTEIINDLF